MTKDTVRDIGLGGVRSPYEIWEKEDFLRCFITLDRLRSQRKKDTGPKHRTGRIYDGFENDENKEYHTRTVR